MKYSGATMMLSPILALILLLTFIRTIDSRPPQYYSCKYDVSTCGEVYLNKTDASILIELQSNFPSLKNSILDWKISLTCGSGWTGICTDSKGKVTEIFLPGYLGRGILPNRFANLEKLVNLDLSSNGLNESSILPIAEIKSLLELRLGENGLKTFPSSFSALSNLLNLDLFSNSLNNSFDVVLKLKSLIVLDLSDNAISAIPSSISLLSNLSTLNLAFNKLTTLPSSLGSLPQLGVLSLSYNSLTDSIFPTIVRLKTLYSLGLADNALRTIPSTISSLVNLISLSLSNNRLGSIPSSLASIPYLYDLGLDNTSLTISSVDKISKLRQLSLLFIDWNNLNYLPPSIGNLTNLYFLSVAFNNLQSNATAEIPKLKSLSYLYAVGNWIATLPAAFGNLKYLRTLLLSDNILDRSVLPIISNITLLEDLDLSNNPTLKGPIPSFSSLTSLHSLSLYNCSFTGSIPYSYGTFTQLTYLNLGVNSLCGGVPSYFANFPDDANIDLYLNRLSGTIPAAVQSKFCSILQYGFYGNCLKSTNKSCPLLYSDPTAVCTATCYPIPNLNKDLAYRATTRQSSTYWVAKSFLAVDGTAGLGSFFNSSCTETLNQTTPWLMVGLKASYKISTVQIYNRLDCCSNRLDGVQVYVGSSSRAYNGAGNSACNNPAYKYGPGNRGFPLNVTCNKSGRYVWVVAPGRGKILTVCEVVVLN